MGRWGRRWTHLPGEKTGPAGSRRVGGRYVAGAAQVYKRGRTRFRSRWELNYSHFLDFLGIAWRYEPQRYYFPGVRRGPAASYLPDFVLATGEIHEVKGYLDKVSAARLRRMGRYYPDVKVIVVDRRFFRDVERKRLCRVIPGWSCPHVKGG
jgi:hypothetical protein